MNTNTEEDFNLALGRRLIMLRQSQKMSQDHLGELLGVSSQQIYKYATGKNRMSPERIQAVKRGSLHLISCEAHLDAVRNIAVWESSFLNRRHDFVLMI